MLLDLKVADLLDDLEITIIGTMAQEASGVAVAGHGPQAP